MSYHMVYLRIRNDGYNFGWTSDTEQAAFKEESRRIFQELGWTLTPGSNGVCDTVTKGHQNLYLHPLSFNGVLDEANIVSIPIGDMDTVYANIAAAGPHEKDGEHDG